MPFLRLTRDRRGFENTFLLHADRPGDRPRLLYWYRTAPGILLGRSPLDEEAIRTIEESHPGIDFDWPAILALSEVMTPEDEAPARPQKKKRPEQAERSQQRDQQRRDQRPREQRQDQAHAESMPEELPEEAFAPEASPALDDGPEPVAVTPEAPANRLLDELVGREIASRLRARFAEIAARIDEKTAGQDTDRSAWLKRAEPLNPDLWVTPDAILDGVRAADGLYESLKNEI